MLNDHVLFDLLCRLRILGPSKMRPILLSRRVCLTNSIVASVTLSKGELKDSYCSSLCLAVDEDKRVWFACAIKRRELLYIHLICEEMTGRSVDVVSAYIEKFPHGTRFNC